MIYEVHALRDVLLALHDAPQVPKIIHRGAHVTRYRLAMMLLKISLAVVLSSRKKMGRRPNNHLSMILNWKL